MKSFQCQHCGQLVFFENVRCLRCGHALGYAPDARVMSALEPEGDGRLRPLAAELSARLYRKCANWVQHDVCNWLIPAQAGGPVLCRACALNRTIPDLTVPVNRERWARVEAAKRRLVYALIGLGLPLYSQQEDPENGLAFDFLADPSGPARTSREASRETSSVTTGHRHGVVTIDVAEADALFSEKMRLELNEAYRTVLGHFRHESGHYYWDRLIRDGPHLDDCRALFGDETVGYDAALRAHYEGGPPADWGGRFVSAYAASHPWEDFAETWAHYLHILDALETVRAFGVSVDVADGHDAPFDALGEGYRPASFDAIVDCWLPLTYALNSISRSMGERDVYPFVLPLPVVEKLRFVHEVVNGAALAHETRLVVHRDPA
jgi:hypothetical protein